MLVMTSSLKDTALNYIHGGGVAEWRIFIFQLYWIMPDCSPKVITAICFISSPMLPTFLTFAILMGAKWYLIVVLSYISINMSDIGNLVWWLLAIWVSSSLSRLFNICILCLFFWFVVFFFLHYSYLCIFNTNYWI